MKAGFFFLVLALTAKAAVIDKVPPSMTWRECESHQHCLEIDFHDGKPTDLALLNPIHKDNDCVLGGHFRDEETKIVVTEECPFDSAKEFEVSFSSPRNPEMTFFKVQGGKTSLVHPELEKGSISSNPKCLKKAYTSLNGTVLPMPKSGFSVSMRIFYDDSLHAKFGGQTTSRVQAALAHANNVFGFPSLQFPIRLDVRHIEYLQGLTWSAEGQHIDYLGYYHTSTGERLFSFWSDSDGNAGVGLALVGEVCGPYAPHRIGIIEYHNSDIETGLTFAHETGHNLGMCHDFTNAGVNDPRYCSANGASCKGINGIMDYGSGRNKWSCCSNEDFYDYYVANYANWCLPQA